MVSSAVQVTRVSPIPTVYPKGEPDFCLEPLLSVRQACKILGIKEKTLRDWVWRKKIDYVKVGDRVMFEPDAIRRFIASNRVVAIERVM